MADVVDQDGKKPAEVKAPRTLRVAEIKAAADRARSEEASPEETPVKGAVVEDPGEKETEGAKAPEVPEKSGEDSEKKVVEEGVKEVDLDPKDPKNPFWKTQLGRHLKEMEGATTARMAELEATITLLKGKAEGSPSKPSTEIEDLERELEGSAADPKTAKPAGEKPAGDDAATKQATYAKAYLANNAVDEYRKDPLFGEIQALMFNRNDKENTYNRAWSEHPDADYRINFVNAKAHLLQVKLASAAESPATRPGEKNLKGEDPAKTAPLGVGGDVKNTDGKAAKPIVLDKDGEKYVQFMKRRGRDPEKVMKRAFAVDLGASRSAGG